jgi:hypothetical protein
MRVGRVSPSLRLVATSRRGCTRETEIEGGGVEVDDDGGEVDDDGLEDEVGDGVLWVGDEVTACSEVGAKAVACSKARIEVVVCSKAGIDDSRRWHDGVYGYRRERTLGGNEKLLSVVRERAGGLKFLGLGT